MPARGPQARVGTQARCGVRPYQAAPGPSPSSVAPFAWTPWVSLLPAAVPGGLEVPGCGGPRPRSQEAHGPAALVRSGDGAGPHGRHDGKPHLLHLPGSHLQEDPQERAALPGASAPRSALGERRPWSLSLSAEGVARGAGEAGVSRGSSRRPGAAEPRTCASSPEALLPAVLTATGLRPASTPSSRGRPRPRLTRGCLVGLTSPVLPR